MDFAPPSLSMLLIFVLLAPSVWGRFQKHCETMMLGWLVVSGFNATLTAKVISWRSVTHYVFPCFLTPVLTQLLFPKPPTIFLTCFSSSERQKYAGKKVHLNQVSNSQPPGHESDMLTTEPYGRGRETMKKSG